MQAKKLLIVESESNYRTAMFRVLSRNGFQVLTAAHKKEAIALLSYGVEVVLFGYNEEISLDLNFIQQMQAAVPRLRIFVFATKEQITPRLQNSNIERLIEKPFDMLQLPEWIQNPKVVAPVQVNTSVHDKYRFENIVGNSPELLKVIDLVDRVADSDATILLTGESGTGKELFAKAIHYNSSRADKNIVPVNCGAIPSELMESELFGHMKGAFTGAIQNRMGRFELANNGTLFLDEIGDLSMNLQVKLLRVLQEKVFEPVGSIKSQKADVRLIAATNIDLEKAVQQGKFREDLFYRLNVIPVHIPALRERTGDVQNLVHHFIHHFNKEKQRQINGVSPEAMEILSQYRWPGNVRELENMMERLTIIKGSGMIQVEDLPEKLLQAQASPNSQQALAQIPEQGLDFNAAVDAYENHLILQALEKTSWNRNQAAKLLRLNRTTLVEKIKKKGLKPEDQIDL